MYSYDQPLHMMFPTTAVSIPAVAVGDISTDVSRLLDNMVILGVVGTVTTVGALTIKFGDGTTPDLYGTFTLDPASVANGPIRGKLVITPAGYEMSKYGPVNGLVTLTTAGAGAISGSIIVGYY